MKLLDLMKQEPPRPIPQSSRGLTSRQAEDLLLSCGKNQLKGKKKVRAFPIFAAQFKDLMVIILLISTAASVFMGEIAEAISIAIIVFANALMGFIQEYKTEKTLEALKNMASPLAKVYRDGKLRQISTLELVPGDLILVEAGDRIPADAVLTEAMSLEADESILTGESLPVSKRVDSSLPETNKLNQPHLIYMGSSVVKGHGKARIIATGMNTQMGKIADMLEEIQEEATPLQKKLNELGKFIAVGCLAISAVIILVGLIRGEPLMQMVITGVSLAVAAVPEGLPAIVTISLALAVKRMIRRKALIRKLHAVETLGCASVVCSDKTGTLTENRMTVRELSTLSNRVTVEGNGYQKAGSFRVDGQRIHPAQNPSLRRMLEISALCNNGELQGDRTLDRRDRTQNRTQGSWEVVGEPTETALLVLAAKAGIFSQDLNYQKLDEIPFDSTRKCMSVLVEDPSGRKWLFTKGAYDVLLEKSNRICQGNQVIPLTHSHRQKLEQENLRMAGSGMRVLGFAYTEVTTSPKEANLVFVGLAGMIDPPRKEAKQAVRTCRMAGVRTVMITGDHKLTACSVAREIGIFRKQDLCLTGAELDKMSDQELDQVVGKVTVFARVSPSHKLKIVRSMKRRGEIVAMTGDGVNDAPAIKEANIGVSMGITGSDVTKQAADVILLDDNFSTLVAAVEEGRVIYRNIRKFIRYLLSCNIGEVVTMFAGMLMGMPIPLLPMQILLVNLVTDGLPAISLGLDPAEPDTMKRKPRDPGESIFSHGLAYTILFRGILIGFTTLSVFLTVFRLSYSVDAARTAAFLTLVLTQLIHVFECKSETKSIFSIPYFNNMKLVLSVLLSAVVVFLAIYLPQMNLLLRTVPLNGTQLGIVFGCSLVVPVINAIFLGLRRRRRKKEEKSNQ